MGRLRRFLAQLGNPHQGYPIIHVGGTSGKGSTSTAIASILTGAGIHGWAPHVAVSPDASRKTPGRRSTRRLRTLYVALTAAVLEAHEEWLARGEDSLTYGEAWFALTALFFRESKIDIAVLEVGAGGRFDLTNVIDPTVSVITSVGIDHTNTLGSTIADIAWHKAGIIKPGIPAVTAVTKPEALAIIVDESRKRGAPLTIIDPDRTVADVSTDLQGTEWTNP